MKPLHTQLSRLLVVAALCGPLALAALQSDSVNAQGTPAAADAAAAELAASDPQSVQELVQAVELKYAEVESLSASFQQQTVSTMIDITMSGTVSLRRPRQMRWDTTADPVGSLVVSDGKKLWMYLPHDKQVHIYEDLSAATGGGLDMDILDNLHQLDETFAVSMGDTGDQKSWALVLKPKTEAGSNYKKIDLVVERGTYALKQVTLTDIFDTRTTYTFTDLKLNPVMPDSTFQFVVPEGVQVIDPTKI